MTEGKRGYHHGNLRQALVEAALKLIEAQGPQGLPVRGGEGGGDVTPAAVYRHFAGARICWPSGTAGYDIFAALLEYAYDDGKPSALGPSNPPGGPILPSRASMGIGAMFDGRG